MPGFILTLVGFAFLVRHFSVVALDTTSFGADQTGSFCVRASLTTSPTRSLITTTSFATTTSTRRTTATSWTISIPAPVTSTRTGSLVIITVGSNDVTDTFHSTATSTTDVTTTSTTTLTSTISQTISTTTTFLYPNPSGYVAISDSLPGASNNQVPVRSSKSSRRKRNVSLNPNLSKRKHIFTYQGDLTCYITVYRTLYLYTTTITYTNVGQTLTTYITLPATTITITRPHASTTVIDKTVTTTNSKTEYLSKTTFTTRTYTTTQTTTSYAACGSAAIANRWSGNGIVGVDFASPEVTGRNNYNFDVTTPEQCCILAQNWSAYNDPNNPYAILWLFNKSWCVIITEAKCYKKVIWTVEAPDSSPAYAYIGNTLCGQVGAPK